MLRRRRFDHFRLHVRRAAEARRGRELGGFVERCGRREAEVVRRRGGRQVERWRRHGKLAGGRFEGRRGGGGFDLERRRVHDGGRLRPGGRRAVGLQRRSDRLRRPRRLRRGCGVPLGGRGGGGGWRSGRII